MDAIENAIRNAFEKGNAEDRTFREKVYRSAFAALDRALQTNPSITVETAIKRRKAMQAKIAEIESEFLPAIEAGSKTAVGDHQSVKTGVNESNPSSEASVARPNIAIPSIDVPVGERFSNDAPSLDNPAGDVTPASTRETVNPTPNVDDVAPRRHVMPVVPDIMPERPLPGSGSSNASAEVSPDRDDRRAADKRRGVPALFVGITLLTLIAIGAWWLFQAGVFKTPEERGELPVPPATVEDEDFAPADEAAAPQVPGQTDASGNWIVVFTPKDPTLVSAPSDAKADVIEDDTGTFLRLRSGVSGSSVSFDVGQGILEQMAGKHAVFVISARAEEGQETQVSVDCNFGELGDCGRKRYAVGHERNEYLFDVQMPDKQPGAAGTIAINSDFDKQGKSVDIYEIRVSAQ